VLANTEISSSVWPGRLNCSYASVNLSLITRVFWCSTWNVPELISRNCVWPQLYIVIDLQAFQVESCIELTILLFYVYWTMHHPDSWIKRDQLDVTCFIISLFNAQHVSDVNTSILRSLLLVCWVISRVVLLWFDVCWCYVVVWLGWCGVVSGCRLQPVHHPCQTTT